MKRISFFHFLSLAFVALLFSCEHKSGVETKESGDTSAAKNSPGIIEKFANATSWKIDANSSEVKFTIKNMGLNVDGSIDGLKGTIFFDENNLKGSSFEASVDVNTINTGIKKRDEDLMGDKFFDEAKYKHIVFHTDSIIRDGNAFVAIGDLAMKGKSQHRRIPFTFSQNGNTGIFKSNFTVNRLDFGIGGEGSVMGSDVLVSLNVVTTKQ
jgi:polyisoprenoid-binding protein YceI